MSAMRSTAEPTLEAALDSGREAADAALVVAERASESARSAAAAVRTLLVSSPYVTLGAAAGVGFVVAGGLASPAVRGLVNIGARIALAEIAGRVAAFLLDAPEAPSAATTAAAATSRT